VIRKTGDKEWKSSLSLNLERGATSAPDMEIMPKTFSLANATVSAKLRINGNRTLLEDRFQTRALPRWWIQLLMAVIGGLLWSIYQVVAPAEPASTKRRRLLARVAVGIIAGIAAYLLASYDILGIKADTSSLRAFVVLGFLFSFVGIEGVLSKMLPRKP